MTQFQESASVPKLVPAERAFPAPFLAIAAGLVVLLMAIAVAAFVLAGRPADVSIQGSKESAAIDGHMAGLTAANSVQRIASAQQLNDGWAATLVTPGTSAAADGWEAALIQSRHTAVDGYIQQFLNER